MHFRAAAAVLAGSAEVHLLAPEVDFRELADESLALVVDSPSPADDLLAAVPGFHAPVAGFRAAAAGSPWLADETLGPVVDSRELAAGSPERADEMAADSHEPGVELLVPVADFRAWVAARDDSEEVHSLARGADFRELAAPSGSPEPARSRALAVDWRVPLASQEVLRSAYSAAPPAAFLPRVAAADWLAALRLCLPAVPGRASHSTQCETRSGWVSSGQRE